MYVCLFSNVQTAEPHWPINPREEVPVPSTVYTVHVKLVHIFTNNHTNTP